MIIKIFIYSVNIFDEVRMSTEVLCFYTQVKYFSISLKVILIKKNNL